MPRPANPAGWQALRVAGRSRPRDARPVARRQWSSKKLQRHRDDYFEVRGLGRVFNAPIDVILSQHDVVQPDLVLVTNPGQISARGIEGPPQLMVDVPSPSTVTYDRATKSQRYAAPGVRHLWFLDPAGRRLQCFRLDGHTWRLVLEADGDQTVEHPDWHGLTIRLGDPWL